MGLIRLIKSDCLHLEPDSRNSYIWRVKTVSKYLIVVCLAATPLVTATSVWAAPDAVQTNWRDNLAAEGYDVVTFFSGKPQPGKAEFSTRYQGADWLFFNQANLDLFLTNPELFAPQYGGYCAWAAARGKIAKGDPDYWHIEDGRLFFNFNARIQRRWDRKRASFIARADRRWPKLIAAD